MAISIRKEDALKYHTQNSPGKIEVIPTKPLSSQRDLALAYSPGVAEPCKAIAENKEDAYKYTTKGNLVAVITNGSAVLGLGDIGPLASKPVMEGKGVLFKKFAGIDVFDLELNADNVEAMVSTIKAMEPTFGGINLEDIKAPECFEVERRLKEETNIPVMHDDQHGTAIITSAALMNALEIAGKKVENIKLVVNGAGASALACTQLYQEMGVKKENIIMLDKDGVLNSKRNDLSPLKQEFATKRNINSLQEAMENADVFLGLSVGNILEEDHIKVMNKDAIVFALANPDPEIEYDKAMAIREDLIMATGRSDHPNQVNNVLGFPYIFRGALDVHASEITESMKLAAAKALAELSKEPVPETVNKAYNDQTLVFGKNYLIPKPLDPRLITTISPAVAMAAMDSGVAHHPIEDWDKYHHELQKRVGLDQELISRVTSIAREHPKKVVFAEADHYKVLKAAQIMQDEELGEPILLGNREKIHRIIEEHNIDIGNSEIINPFEEKAKRQEYGNILFEKRKRKGVTAAEGYRLMRDRNYFGAMMVELGLADAFISGLTRDYPKTIIPALQVIGKQDSINKVASMYIMNNKHGTYFFADTTVNTDPTEDELVDIIGLTAKGVRFFNIEPRIAVLSYSNFGSSKGEVPEKTMRAREKAKKKYPDLLVEGDIQANTALNTELQKENYPFSELAEEGANTLIFPNLASGNIAYKLLQEMGNTEAIGPILMGMKKPVHILQLGSSVRDIVNMVAIAVTDAHYQNGVKETM